MPILTCVAPVNIAVIKYWGKRNESLILPLNDSVSATLNTEQLCTKTTIFTSSNLPKDRMWLNGKEELTLNTRLLTCLSELRKRAGEKRKVAGKEGKDDISQWKVHIYSENNFPTGAGLASSAAGYACLVYCLAKILEVDCEMTSLARLGSGSACRSLLGGFVRWHCGLKDDGSDSLAKQIVTSKHWTTLRIIILVVNDNKKKISSTYGMQRSVETSELLKYRVANIVPQRTLDIIKAIENKDFNTFAEITMKDSNQFHSICMDTYPPAVYLNEVSHAIIDLVHNYNKLKGSNQLAYTFDAGPNACLFVQEHHLSEVITVIKHAFPPRNDIKNDNFIKGLSIPQASLENESLLTSINSHEPGLVKYIIITKLGDGPNLINDHMLDENGVPKKFITDN